MLPRIIGNWARLGGASRQRATPLPRSYLTGLDLTRTDADTITVAVGVCRDTGDTMNLNLAATIAKDITGTWAEGGGNGGMNDGDAEGASEWFAFHLLGNPVSGTVDAGFDVNADASLLLADAAVVAAGYTKYRRIGWVRTNATPDLINFIQDGDLVQWLDLSANGTDIDNATLDADPAVDTALSFVPANVTAILNVYHRGAASTGILVSDPGVTAELPTVGFGTGGPMPNVGDGTLEANQLHVRTDGSRQVKIGGDASINIAITSVGWIDRRGRDD